MWELAGLLALMALCWFWFDSMRARELALAKGRQACESNGLQFLDETVECISLKLARNDVGHRILRRKYRFEFSDNGSNRRAGNIVVLADKLESITMEPFLLH